MTIPIQPTSDAPNPPIPSVVAGDLISASVMNQVIDAVNGLEARLRALESGGSAPGQQVIIDELVPSASVVAGTELRIVGRNFDYVIGAVRLFVGTTQVRNFKGGSSDRELIVDVPNLGSQPLLVDVTALNRSTSAKRQIAVLPPQLPLLGNVVVEIAPNDAGAIKEDDITFFKVDLLSKATRAADFTITATVSVAGWQGGLQVLDSTTGTIPLTSVFLEPLKRRTVYLKLPIPAGTAGTTFTATISVAAGAASGSVLSPTYTVGTPGEQPDPNITLAVSSASPPNALTGTKISLSLGGSVVVTLVATYMATGTYDVTPSSSGTGWQLTSGNANDHNPTFPSLPSGGKSLDLEYQIDALATAAKTGLFEVVIKRRGEQRQRRLTLELERVP